MHVLKHLNVFVAFLVNTYYILNYVLMLRCISCNFILLCLSKCILQLLSFSALPIFQQFSV